MPFVKKDRGRGRCKNCYKHYRKCQVNQEYCSPKCRKEFNVAGGVSFGRLARLVEKKVAAEMKKQRALIVAEIERRARPEEAAQRAQAIHQAISALQQLIPQ